MKKCSKCKVKKPQVEFYIVKGKPFSWCKNCCKKHRKRYKEYNRIYMRTYRAEKPNIIREWRLNNVDKVREADKRRYIRDHEKRILLMHKRRMVSKQVSGTHTVEEWEDLKYAYGYKCWICGKQEPEIKLTKDHMDPISKGGTDSIYNIMPLCLHCNCSKGNRTTEWYKQRLAERSF